MEFMIKIDVNSLSNYSTDEDRLVNEIRKNWCLFEENEKAVQASDADISEIIPNKYGSISQHAHKTNSSFIGSHGYSSFIGNKWSDEPIDAIRDLRSELNEGLISDIRVGLFGTIENLDNTIESYYYSFAFNRLNKIREVKIEVSDYKKVNSDEFMNALKKACMSIPYNNNVINNLASHIREKFLKFDIDRKID